MEKVIIIKLYRNEISCADYSDLNLENFGRLKEEAAEFAKSYGKRLLFTVCRALDACDFDAFCEIVTNSELTEEEAAFYKRTIGEFCGDATISRSELREYRLPAPIIMYSVKDLKIL